MTFLSTLAFRATKILSTVGVHISVTCSFKSYQNYVNSGSWHCCRLSLSEPPKSFQQRELVFLSTVAFRGIKIKSTVRVDISVDFSFKSYKILATLRQFLLTIDFRAAKILEQWEMTFLLTIDLKTTKILSTMEPYISFNRSIQGYQNSVNSWSWHFCECSLKIYQNPVNCHNSKL